MKHLPQLFENNRAWAGELRKSDPEFFTRLCRQQAPPYFWIGCSDSRVPANQIVGLRPGELFVHRNIANIFVHSDLNALSALHFAVDVLKVSHVIVCGHYGCSGIRASLVGERHGLVDNWLRHIGDVREKHRHRLASLAEDDEYACLCELNVIEQVRNVSNTTVVRDAWARGHSLAIHGWIYGLTDGLLVDLGVSGRDEAEINASYCRAAGS
ncbi:MAG: carbonate dehydratase [Thermoanaerobaculia bacterium]|nr:carbonate dehydratase [Thermoanaerobaculia bacterium]